MRELVSAFTLRWRTGGQLWGMRSLHPSRRLRSGQARSKTVKGEAASRGRTVDSKLLDFSF